MKTTLCDYMLEAMIILSHTTALCCFRHLGAEAISSMPRYSLGEASETFDTPARAVSRYLSYAESVGMAPVPLHTVRLSGSRRPSSECIRVHTQSNFPPKSLIRLAPGVFAVCPELVACQLAEWGSLNDLTYLLHELCGMYLHESNGSISLAKRKRFTSTKKLEEFVASRPTFSGKATLKTAIKLTRDNSASHMETALSMLYGFPCRLGGFGLPDFELNRKIVVPGYDRERVGRSELTVDLCWFSQKVALEYDSAAFHNTVFQVAKDSSKRTALLQMGFRVVSLSGGQVSLAGDRASGSVGRVLRRVEVSRTAFALAKILGYRYQPRGKDYDRCRERLEWTVFQDQASIFSGDINIRSKGFHPKAILQRT